MPDVAKKVTTKDILEFAQRVKANATPAEQRSNDVRAVIIERLLSADTMESVLEAAQISLPSMEDYVGVPVKVLDFALVASNFESTDAYALVDAVTKDGEKVLAAWGGQSVVDTLVRLREIGVIPMASYVKLSTKKTSNGYEVYNIVAAK